MKLRYPKYYEKFSCIGGECEDTCCAGWEIDIDDNSYQYYMQIPGKLGKRIRDSIKEYQSDNDDAYESHGFILQEGMRCPFLNKDNLCEIILELGEDALCDVCADTPRNFLEYGNAREISISPSCAQAGRLIFGSREKTVFTERESDEEWHLLEGKEELAAAEAIRTARDGAIAILQDRDISIYQRICNFLLYAKKIQSFLNQNQFSEVLAYPAEKFLAEGKKGWEQNKNFSLFACFQERMETFRSLDSINGEWDLCMGRIDLLFLKEKSGQGRYEETFFQFREYLKKKNREYAWEQFMVYYAFLLLARSVDGHNFWGKAQACVCSFLMVQDMAIEQFFRNGESFFIDDFVDVTRVYAKEVEHSEQNIEFLEDEFLFGDIYCLEALCSQVLPQK